jgi:hypothetical protein
VPYDELFTRFYKAAPRVMVLNLIRPSYSPQLPHLSPRRFAEMLDPGLLSGSPAFQIFTTTGMAPITGGKYRIEYGVPRRLWPMGNNKLQESYEYELIDKIGRDRFDFVSADLEHAAGGKFPLMASECMGVLNTETGTWNSAMIRVKTRQGEKRVCNVR